MHAQLTNLASAIAASDELLSRAERQGMEVRQPKLQQTQARDALLKARVAVHAFRDSELKRDIDGGLATTKLTHAAGEKAMQEWKFRRVGLGLSLVMIALALLGDPGRIRIELSVVLTDYAVVPVEKQPIFLFSYRKGHPEWS
jgi:hypothetical protein